MFAEKSVEEIRKLVVWEGKRKRVLSDLFVINDGVNYESENVNIMIFGDAGKIQGIGTRMSNGKISIEGDVGMHLGEEMKGGSITVTGNAGSWTGSMMKGGNIEIKGNVGDYVGAPYRGSTKGMNGGTIVVQRNAGNEIGCYMRKGLIEIYGNVGQFTGIHMKDGTIFVHGNSEERIGAQMYGGRIIMNGHIPSILPTFTFEEIKKSAKINKEKFFGPFYMFKGDISENGTGKLYISQIKNPHLNFYEKFLE